MKGTFFSSLRARLILLVLLAVIPALGVICYVAQEQRRVVSVEAQQNALRLARLVSANQDGLIEGARQLLTALAQVPVVRASHPVPCSAFLGDLLKAYPLYANFGVADPKGEIFCSGLPLKAPVNAADRAWFQRAVQTGDFAIGDYQIGRITGKATVNFGYPILDDRGQTQAVAFAALDLAWFNKLAAKTQLPPGTVVTLIDRNRTILVRFPDPGKWIGQGMPEGSLLEAVRVQKGEGTAEATGIDGTQRLYGFAALGDGTVIVGIPSEVAYAPAKRILMHSLGWLMLICTLAVGGAWLGGNWLILRQVNSLIGATRRLGAGDLNVRAGLSDDEGELHQLAHAFDQMAEALQTRQTEAEQTQEQLQRHLQESTALREINLAVTSTLDLHAVLNVLMEKIDVFLPYAAVQVWLMNHESRQLERAACWNLDEQEWKSRQLADTPALVKAAMADRVPVVAHNVQTDPRTLAPEFYRRQGLVSYLGVPLLIKDQVLGVLVFLTREEHQFTDEEIQFLSTLAGHAAIAIHNAQLHQQTKRQAVALEKANSDLRRKEEIQRLLKELSQDITSLHIDELLTKIAEKVKEFLRVDVSDVRLVEPGGSRIVGASGIEVERLRVGTTGTGRGISGWITKNRRPLVISDIAKEHNLPMGETTRRIGIRGYVAVPLFSRGGAVIGTLRALTREPREFTQEELDLLQQMANGAGVAVENARLLEHIKNQAVELEKADKVKNEFLGFVSHELKTPVNTIVGYTEMMHSKLFGEVNADQEKALEKVMANSKDLLDMINSLLEATKIEAGAVSVESQEVNLYRFFDELRSNYCVPLDKKLDLIWDCSPDLPVVKTDNEKLRHILQNLINNAIKYTDEGSVTISARHFANVSSVEFRVTDTGIGIPEEALPFIFEMFHQVNGSENRSCGGVGLGLHIVKRFTELLGGKIDVESQPGRGSVFTLTIPCASQSSAIVQKPVRREERRLDGRS
jgi:signal transduction histidine kinase